MHWTVFRSIMKLIGDINNVHNNQGLIVSLKPPWIYPQCVQFMQQSLCFNVRGMERRIWSITPPLFCQAWITQRAICFTFLASHWAALDLEAQRLEHSGRIGRPLFVQACMQAHTLIYVHSERLQLFRDLRFLCWTARTASANLMQFTLDGTRRTRAGQSRVETGCWNSWDEVL